MEDSRRSGALGNWPRRAWLPTTTMSRWLVMAAAARRTCSSEARFITAQNGLAFGGAENACERAGLAQPHRLLLRRTQQLEQLRQRQSVQQPLPFAQGGSGPGSQPAFQ